MKKAKKIIGPVLGLLAVVLAISLTAYRLQLLTGFPKGVDAYAYLTRLVWILTRFPQIHWNPSWNSGNFFWLWSYPPIGVIVTAATTKLLSITPEQAWNLVNFSCFLAFGTGFYLTLTFWAGSWLAIPISLLAVTTPALFSWWGHGGNYFRIWGMGFYGLTMAVFVSYLKKPRKLTYALLIIFLALTLMAHMLFTALTLASLAGYILFAVKGMKNKMIMLLKTAGVGILLSGFWYIPMAATTTSERFLEPSLGGPVAWSDLFSLNYKLPFFSLPFYFTLVMGASFLAAFVVLFLKKRSNQVVWGAVPAFTLGLLGSLVYAFGRNFAWFPKSFSASGFAPFAAFPFIIIFACFMAASALGVILGRYKNSIGVIILALVASGGVILLSLNTDFSRLHVYDMTRRGEVQTLAIPPVRALSQNQEFRFGTDSAFVADWFNYLYPHIPQTRHYIYQGTPYKAWQYFQEYSLWTQTGRYPEAEWLLDWYGVKYFTVGLASPATKYDKFLSRPDLFELKYGSNQDNYYVFEYKNPQPILVTSAAPAVLVIGQPQDYEIFVRGLALIGWGPDRIIPVYGGKKISQFKGQLDRFGAVFLYHYHPANSPAENLVISRYLEKGGRILIEALPKEQPQVWPAWSPVEKSELVLIKDRWDLTVDSEFSMIEDEFSPPLFKGDAWKAAQGVPAAEATILLKAQNLPLVIKKGQVIWSSLNLPYHAESYRNEKEMKFLVQLLGLDGQAADLGRVEILNNQPQQRIWQIEKKATGLVWKETWFPRWTINWTDTQGKKGKLGSLMAGPALSYIFLPQEAVYPLILKATYHQISWDYLGWGVTLTTVLVLILYLLGRIPKNFLNFGGWWDAEE